MPRIPLFLALLALALPAAAQPGSFGIGGQIGSPTGLTIKVRTPVSTFDAAAGWHFGENVFVQGHLILVERRLPVQGTSINYFYGPGLFLGAREDAGGGTDAVFGFSGNVGVSYYTGQVEFFGQLTPRLRLSPDSDFDLGVALGIRFYP